MPSDIEIAQAAKLQRISAVAREKLGIPEEHLEPYGHYKAKISLDYLDTLQGQAGRQARSWSRRSARRRRAKARPRPPSAWATRSTASARRR